jgi:hypothetical protein
MQAIADREREISAITDRAISSTKKSVRTRIDKMRVAARKKMNDLRRFMWSSFTALQK